MDQVESEELFQECDNTFIAKEESKESLTDLYSEHINVAFEKCEENVKVFAAPKQYNNNHHVVHVGVIIVLLTIYLGMTSVHKCAVGCVENTSITEQLQEHKDKILNHLHETEQLKNAQILERLLEYKDICKDLEIFTKDSERRQHKKEEEDCNIDNDDHTKDTVKNIEVDSTGVGENVNEDEDSSGSSGNGDCAKNLNRHKHKKSKYAIKTTTNKNDFNKHNKSTKAKSQKKDLNLNKKNSTAEPIIYLFALVFIYLLLKAASDINQHYKSQNKNDKRLRRCSLQSYAQTHRPDRRASKEMALKRKQQQLQHRLKSLSRSSSQDQQSYHYNNAHQQHLVNVLPQNFAEQKQPTTTVSPIRPKDLCSSNWQLLRQHITTQSLDNSDILNSALVKAEMPTSMMARRCSVPAALSYQRPKCSTSLPFSAVNEHVNLNATLSRRTSIVSPPLSLAMDSNDSLIPENKRRVRMINRH